MIKSNKGEVIIKGSYFTDLCCIFHSLYEELGEKDYKDAIKEAMNAVDEVHNKKDIKELLKSNLPPKIYNKIIEFI